VKHETLTARAGRNARPFSCFLDIDAGVKNLTPATVIGADGKQYPATKLKPTPKPYVIVDKPKVENEV